MNRRRIAIGVSSVSGLAVVAAGAVSMLGSGRSAGAVDLHESPVAAVSSAADATRQAGTAQTDTVLTIASPALPARGRTAATPPQTLTMHGVGVFDFGRQLGSLDLTVPPTSATVKEVLMPGTVWARREATAATPTAGAAPASPWSQTATARSADGGVITGGATEPSLVLAMLAGVQPGVREVGQDIVRGVPVAHYQGTLDLAKAAAAPAGPVPAADRQAIANAAHAFLTDKVPFDAYLDAQGRLRRFVASFSFAQGGPSKPVAQVTSATELFGFGAPFAVTVPTTAAPTTPRHRATTSSAHLTSHTRAHK